MNGADSFNQGVDRRKHVISLLDILRFGGGGGRLDAIAKLKQVEKAAFLEVVLDFLEHPDLETRRVGIEALMETDPENNIEFVLPLLNDAEPYVRSAVIYRIKQSKVAIGKGVVELLIRALREDPSPDVRTQAAEMLGYCNISEAKTALLWSAEHDFEWDDQGYVVSDAAKMALKRLDEGDI